VRVFSFDLRVLTQTEHDLRKPVRDTRRQALPDGLDVFRRGWMQNMGRAVQDANRNGTGMAGCATGLFGSARV
jgi:hypothetical protein